MKDAGNKDATGFSVVQKWIFKIFIFTHLLLTRYYKHIKVVAISSCVNLFILTFWYDAALRETNALLHQVIFLGRRSHVPYYNIVNLYPSFQQLSFEFFWRPLFSLTFLLLTRLSDVSKGVLTSINHVYFLIISTCRFNLCFLADKSQIL